MTNIVIKINKNTDNNEQESQALVSLEASNRLNTKAVLGGLSLSIEALPLKGAQKLALEYGVEAHHVSKFTNIYQAEAFNIGSFSKEWFTWYDLIKQEYKLHKTSSEEIKSNSQAHCLNEALKIDNPIKLAAVSAGMHTGAASKFTNLCQVAAAHSLGNEKNTLAQDILKINNPCQVEAIASGNFLPGDVVDMKCEYACPTIQTSGEEAFLAFPA